MIYILLSILCSVTVAILLKLARRYKINIAQAVTFNYFFAILLSVLFFRPDRSQLTTIPSPVYIGLGFLLPAVFWLLAGSIRRIGIVKTDIAQRLSLFLPVVAAWLIFQEHFTTLHLFGLIVGFIAIVLILLKTESASAKNNTTIYPILVFFGFGIIDILFKKVAQIQIIPYTTSLVMIFCISFIIALIGMLYLVFFKKEKFQLINFICGCILGLFNFGNILFYLKAHKAFASQPSVVFASMNIGVIIIGSLVGIFLFKEKLNRLNYIGLFMALTAIILITLSTG